MTLVNTDQLMFPGWSKYFFFLQKKKNIYIIYLYTVKKKEEKFTYPCRKKCPQNLYLLFHLVVPEFHKD